MEALHHKFHKILKTLLPQNRSLLEAIIEIANAVGDFTFWLRDHVANFFEVRILSTYSLS